MTAEDDNIIRIDPWALPQEPPDFSKILAIIDGDLSALDPRSVLTQALIENSRSFFAPEAQGDPV